jgi:hypothetical protein
MARFWSKVEKQSGEYGTCWLWTGCKMHKGYGLFDDGRTRRVHRWSYETFIGPIPEGLVLDHLCRVRHCVNPDHLEAVTQAENNRRMLLHKKPTMQCIHGHSYTPENKVITKQGFRCRECKNSRRRKK